MILSAMLLVSVVGYGTTLEDNPDDPFKPLQGSWTLSALEVEGMQRDLLGEPPRWVIHHQEVFYGREVFARLTLDATTTPPSINLTITESDEVYEGVYSLLEDTLRICVSRPTGSFRERPLDFETQDHPDRRLLVFQRDDPPIDPSTEGLEGYVGLAIRNDEVGMRILVDQVFPESPADKAGVKKGDVLEVVGTVQVTDLLSVVNAIRGVKPESKLVVQVRRGEEEKEIVVTVGVVPFLYLD